MVAAGQIPYESRAKGPLNWEQRWQAGWRAAEDGCWIWQGRLDSAGYGIFTMGGGPSFPHGKQAHRHAYLLYVGRIPEGLEVDHLCNVRACVNPAHLEVVTQQENKRRAFTRKWGPLCKHGVERDGSCVRCAHTAALARAWRKTHARSK